MSSVGETFRKFFTGKYDSEPGQKQIPKTEPASVGGTHAADALAGEGSFADKLRKRRIAIENGDPSGGQGDGDY